MKSGHLTDLEVLDLVLGDPIADGCAEHVGQCADCAKRVRTLDEGRHLALESSLPEPDEAFWRQLHAGIATRLERQAARPGVAAFRLWWRWSLAATAAVVLSVGAWSLRSALKPPVGGQPTPAPMVSSEDDAALTVTNDVVPTVDDEAQSLVACTSCLDGLTDEESRSVIDGLRAEMGKKS